MEPTVSVIINTLNRACWLASLLSALRRQNYTKFEVIVVNGPSTDNTEQVLAAYSATIRIGRCRHRNLSVSRNIGIAMAEGELVAFLDDDAIPDENWIADLAAGFDAADVAAAGGSVYDCGNSGIQYRVCVVNRLGEPRFDLSTIPPYYPGSPQIPYLVGCNCMFRRDILVEIGAFDEEYEYYLDEVDVCTRLVDAGYRLKLVPRGCVYHASAPGQVRNNFRVMTNWYPVLKNKLYFALKHTPDGFAYRGILQSFDLFAAEIRTGMRRHLDNGLVTQEVIDKLEDDIQAARRDGIVAGLCPRPRGASLDVSTPRRSATSFRTYPTLLAPGEKLNICLLSQGYLPESPSGIPRLTFELAGGLAELGHTVHVLTKTGMPDSSIGYEHEVWVHRLAPLENSAAPPGGAGFQIELWKHSRRLLDEVRAIHRRHPVDIVEGPVWDFEGLATVLSGEFCTITNLETPLKMNLITNPEWNDPNPGTQAFFESIVKGEAAVTSGAAGVRAISAAVVHTMESLYGLHLDPGRVFVTPLGLKDRFRESVRKEDGAIDILFVGRFETRKGIDVLLEVVPRICGRYPQVRFTLAGGDSPRAQALTEEFRGRVRFPGKVSEEALDELLAACDIFVAPSRYESFGLVYLEAMMFGKPVVACNAGGVPEVVRDGVSGLLADPGDAESLDRRLAALIENAALREQYGDAGRKLFLAHYTRERFVARTLECYRRVLRSWKGVESACGG